jgi:hypothetical protein
MPSISTQWRVTTLTLTAATAHACPLDVAVTTAFTGPDGNRLDIPAFYAGEGTWQVRFAPTAPGTWHYHTRCAADDGLDGQAGMLEVAPAEGDNPLYRHGGFLRVGANLRHLTYADGTPFFWLGDTWWFCPSHLMPFDSSNRPEIPSMYCALIDLRAAQGYSVVHWAFLGTSGVGGMYADLYTGTFNAANWQDVDRYIAYANDAGIMPVIGLGFHHGLDSPTLEELQRVWAYVLARYGACAVSWLICGEYNLASHDGKYTETDEARIEKVLALGQFIKDHDPYHRAMTVHPWWYGGDQRQAWTQPWYDFILLQGGHGQSGPPAELYREVYADNPSLPLLEGEVTYEGIFGFSDAVVRRNAYKAIQSGSFGFTYGAHGLWYPTQDEQDDKFKDWGAPIPWWEAMRLPGAAHLQHLRRCYELVDWPALEPRDAEEVVVTERECFAKADGDRTFVLYIGPGEGDVTLKPSGYAITRFDPRTGETVDLQGPMPALDEQDWVVILRKE